jgi:hypothetical protein
MITRMFPKALNIYRNEGYKGLIQKVLHKLLEKMTSADASEGSVPKVWTSYISWLTFANPGMLLPGNVHCFDYAIKRLPSQSPIVEIGSFCGLSTNMLTYCKECYGVKNPLITCDKWIFEGAEHGGMLGDSKTLTHADYRSFVRETFIRNISFFSRYDLPYTVEMFSDELFDAWRNSAICHDVLGRSIQLGGAISFCYIDGNHSYAYAKRDFEHCDAYLEPGGFLLFDDSADGSGWDVCKVVREVMDTTRYNLIAKNPNYFFQKK